MSNPAAGQMGDEDPHNLGRDDDVPISEQGPAPKRIVVAYGF